MCKVDGGHVCGTNASKFVDGDVCDTNASKFVDGDVCDTNAIKFVDGGAARALSFSTRFMSLGLCVQGRIRLKIASSAGTFFLNSVDEIRFMRLGSNTFEDSK